MKQEITIPPMGESITEATIGKIIKPTGSPVEMDDEILELETDKVNLVLHAPQKGVVSLTVKTGDSVKVGQPVGFVDTEKEASAPPAPAKKAETKVEAAPAPKPVKKVAPEPVKSTPPPAAQKPQVSRDARETRTRMTAVRKVIAARLLEAQHTTAMLTTFNEIDLTKILALREKYKESFEKKHGVRLGFMPFFVKAVVEALKAVPQVNSYIDGDDFVHREYYDIGIAVSTDRGVIVPVVRDCDKLTFPEIEKKIESFATHAREGTLTLEDLRGGGFTITNGGVFGSLFSTPILHPPQSGILGMHKIEKRPVVVNDQVVVRSMMYLALSYDHRVIDGKEAVTFLVHIKNHLEDPCRILLNI